MFTRKDIFTESPFQSLTSPSRLGFHDIITSQQNNSDEFVYALRVPVITAPEDEEVIATEATTVTWSAVDRATSYDILILVDDIEGEVHEDDDGIEALEYETTVPFITETDYFIRVRARNATQVSEWSAPVTISVVIPPEDP